MNFQPDVLKGTQKKALIGADKFYAHCCKIGGLDLALLTVIGCVTVPNPGIEPKLIYATPQGFNPRILLLNLVFDQKPGFWPQVETTKPVGYTMLMSDCSAYDQVSIVNYETVDITIC